MSINRKDFTLTKLAEKVHFYYFIKIIYNTLYKNVISHDV